MSAEPFTLDPQPGPNIGVVVLQADETLEQDFRRLIPPAARLYISRVPSGLEATTETLAAMETRLGEAAGLFPRSIAFDAVGYGCTSASAVIGPERVAAMIRQGAPARAVTEPVSALIAACRVLGITRLALLSPYVAEVSETLRRVLATSGIATPLFASFDEALEERVVRISAGSVAQAGARLAAHDGAEALFLSCTNLRTLDAIPEIEARTGKPVLSSNLVLAWHLCRLAGLDGDFGALTGAPAG